MTLAAQDPGDSAGTMPRMPRWITVRHGEAVEDAAFSSGAALGALHPVLAREDIPQVLLRDRLALRAAAACVALTGRPERQGDLRDAVALLRPGDRPGPAGEVFLCWRRAVGRPLSARVLHRALPEMAPDRIAAWCRAGQGTPVARAAATLEAVLAGAPRSEAAALILADAVLARALGWRQLLPLLGVGLRPRDLRASGEGLRLACHRAVVAAAAETLRMAGVLAGRAAHLRAVAPKLRARGAGAAVELFLARDAVAPAMLTGWMSDRAARRLCDRLVRLGAVRELTGRDAFRLYGV